MAFRFIDLFAGIGGSRIAFEQAGGECVFACDINPHSQYVYEMNFGERPYGDIKEIKGTDIPDHDVLVGGFPLERFSAIGNNKKKPTHKTLFYEVVRILKEKRPRAFLLESVPLLKSMSRGEELKNVIRILCDQGYHVYDQLINAKGAVPQDRLRLYIVGFRDPVNFEFPALPPQGPSFQTILEDRVDQKYTLTDQRWNSLKERHHPYSYNLLDGNSPSMPLDVKGLNLLIPFDGGNPRKLTPRECARLQGFPECFSIVTSDKWAYLQFAQSSVVPVVRLIAERIFLALEQHEPVHSIKWILIRLKK